RLPRFKVCRSGGRTFPRGSPVTASSPSPTAPCSTTTSARNRFAASWPTRRGLDTFTPSRRLRSSTSRAPPSIAGDLTSPPHATLPHALRSTPHDQNLPVPTPRTSEPIPPGPERRRRHAASDLQHQPQKRGYLRSGPAAVHHRCAGQSRRDLV